jgi:hypothetical protein
MIITCHQLRLDRPISALSNSPLKDQPSPIRPIGLQFSTIFAILLLFIPVTCRGQFCFKFLVYRKLV